MRHTAHACTGGLTSPNANSYAGSCPFGCMYHSRISSSSCCFANCGSKRAIATQWNARSHAANHGYSQPSGIEITSRAHRFSQPRLRPCARRRRRRRLRRIAVHPVLDDVVIELARPHEPGVRLPDDRALLLGHRRRSARAGDSDRPRRARRSKTASKSANGRRRSDCSARSRMRSTRSPPAGTSITCHAAHFVPSPAGSPRRPRRPTTRR